MKTKILLVALLLCTLPAFAAKRKPLKLEDIQDFQVRFRVTAVADKAPAEDQKFSFMRRQTSTYFPVTGSEWTDWLQYDRELLDEVIKGYPQSSHKWWPLTFLFYVQDLTYPATVEFESRFKPGGPVTSHSVRLFGNALFFHYWEDENEKPIIGLPAQYNQRYWDVIKNISIPENERPKLFPICDTFMGQGQEFQLWEDGIANLARIGFTALGVDHPDPILRDIMRKNGIQRTWTAIFVPPAGLWNFGGQWVTGENIKPYVPISTQEDLDAWAQKHMEPYYKAGFTPEEIAMFIVADEPSWDWKWVADRLNACPEAMKEFHDYLAAQGLKPQDVGAQKWADVKPLPYSEFKDKQDQLTARKLLYWTWRFFAWTSTRHMANYTTAVEKAVRPGIPAGVNWNTFSGRFVTPGPEVHGSHDWLEFGRMRGGTMMATEDWFGDDWALQWSFYAAKLRSAAEKSGGTFGSLVIPRTAGQQPEGITQKVLTLVGHGAKAIQYFVFGPEYVFPVNCYSENLKVLPGMAEAHRLIGKAESVLWPGIMPPRQVAIFHPRSAMMWDKPELGISDATNNNLNARTVDYMAEIFNLYRALQHANIPADFVEEEDLTPQGLERYKILYVTAPNIPVEFQKGLLEWVKKGGAVVTVTGAGAADRYNTPSDIMAKGLGITEQPRERMAVRNVWNLEESGKGTGEWGEFTAIGPRGKLSNPGQATVLATFADNNDPAVIERKIGSGRVVHFTWMPGISYQKTGATDAMRTFITRPALELAGITPPVIVDQPKVEAPLLLSDKGAAVTVLNWTGEASLEKVGLTVRLPFTAKSVESMKRGKLTFEQAEKGITFSLPLDAVDVIVIKP